MSVQYLKCDKCDANASQTHRRQDGRLVGLCLAHTTVRKTFTELGLIILHEAGTEACIEGYGTDDPEWVGRYAIEYGDINPDGTLN